MSYNIAVLGIAGVGKTTYINRLRGLPFRAPYARDFWRQDYTVEFNTNAGPIRITFNDYDGSNIFRKSEDYIENTDAVIYMFDVTAGISLRRINELYRSFGRRLPAILIANKIDVLDRKIIGEPRHPVDMEYTEVSSKRPDDHSAPILKLLKSLTGNPDLEFV